MLDAVTKRRIDTARNILVGRVPDPKSQVEQITIALIYKFMDDMDAQSEELGGQRKFFAGDFAHYGWAQLLRAGLGGQEMLNRYAEAIYRMPENPGLPPLFRNIFSNAYLPYRDPETLREFLKVIDEFSYDDSESLGDAFESLLAALDAQGDAGQFRTPRHIIDFIVAVIDPKKDETILDPACGTAGFLISAYKHILAANTDANGAVALTPDERRRLAGNLHGYDLSPDLVRLSLVNMYLHGFADPQIYEYDTLTSEERWQDFADVIMANPPFMSPKGGIRPHNRFSVPSRRSEVLFVDYIAEHLTPGGRAGVIVPEGVIFQSQRGHTQLRRLLVADYLVAVVSLPAGVFQPYSGVKTSILILDRTLAPRADGIAFFKIVSDGYDLGAQRRPIDDNDLPTAQAELTEYLRRVRQGIALDDYRPTLGLVVSKERIAADGEYGLNGENYYEREVIHSSYPRYPLGSLIGTVTPPAKIPKSAFKPAGLYPIIDQSQKEIAGFTNDAETLIFPEQPLVIFGDHTCVVKLADVPFVQGADGIKIISTRENLDPGYLYHTLRNKPLESDGYRRHFTLLKKYEIPLPPLDVQRELVAEIEGYQRVIDGCQAVVDNWRPRIEVDPEWEMVAIGKIATVQAGNSAPQGNEYFEGGQFPFIRTADVGAVHRSAHFRGTRDKVNDKAVSEKRLRLFPQGTILFPKSGASTFLNHRVVMAEAGYVASHLTGIICDSAQADPIFVYHQLCQVDARNLTADQNYPSLRAKAIADITIALPPIPVQQAIVAELEAEAAAVEQARGLAERMAGRIAAAVGRVWGTG